MIFFNKKMYDENVTLRSAIADNFGISYSFADYLCYKAGFSRKCKLVQISSDFLKEIESFLFQYYNFSKLRRRFKEIGVQNQIMKGSYRGKRLALGLPARGQRTHTNAQTAKRLRTFLSK